MINLSGAYLGRISLGDKVIDFNGFNMRRKTSDKDLDDIYNEFIIRLPILEDCFESRSAFGSSRRIVSDVRPEFVARDPEYPPIYHIPNFKDKRYFYSSRMAFGEGEVGARIEMPNDRNHIENKINVFSIGTNYLLRNYITESGRRISDLEELQSAPEGVNVHNFAIECLGIPLTDYLLEDDKDALFEHRWMFYELYRQTRGAFLSLGAFGGIASMFAGVFINPAFLTLMPVSLALPSSLHGIYKSLKKKGMTDPLPRPENKI